MAELSENDIKKVALALLKQHYRFRPRSGHTVLQQDMRAEGDIIIDGYLSFPREGEQEKPFVATFEATSYPTRNEVRYRIQQPLLSWEATAVSALLVTGILSVLHVSGYYPLIRMGTVNTLLSVFVLIIMGHLLYRAFFSYLKRYRYIYAVEQFKQYYADEQWVAAGEDVFSDNEDKYFRELRDQCIYQGFGLIIVDAELQGHIHITPSRADLFEGSRRRLRFQTLEEFTRKLPIPLPQGVQTKLIGNSPASAGASQSPRRRRNWMRDPFRFFHQFTVVVFALTLMAILFYLQWLERPVLVVNEEAYEQRLLDLKEARESQQETLDFLIDTPAVEPFRRKVTPYLELDPAPLPADKIPSSRPAGLIAIDGQGKVIELPCERVQSNTQTRFVLEIGLSEPRTNIREVIRSMNAKGLRAMGLWNGCFHSGKAGHILVLAPFYNTRLRAEREIAAAGEALQSNGFKGSLRIVELAQQ